MPAGCRDFSKANGVWGCLIIKGKHLKVHPAGNRHR
jgi:hypothetical protein